MRLNEEDAATFARCISVGGVAVFPSDTVYGLACDAGMREAVERLYALKGRRPDKPAAVMFFRLDLALDALPDLGPHTRNALESVLPGPVTVLLPNPAGRYPLAGGGDVLGVRVPALPPEHEALETVRWPVLQTSANRAGGPDPRTLGDVPQEIRHAADLVLDGGVLPGNASTVVDLCCFETTRDWTIVRQGALDPDDLRDRLTGL